MSMTFPGIENQQFSEKTLKGFLLKNVDPTTTNPDVKALNTYLVAKVDIFWDDVIKPLEEKGHKINGNKINWYYEVYKEGLEARKLTTNPFPFLEITDEQISEIVDFFDGKSLLDYLELGTSFLSNTYSLLSSWVRDQFVLTRLDTIYNSNDPVDWILRAEEEEHGVMNKKPENVAKPMMIMNNIGMIMSKRA